MSRLRGVFLSWTWVVLLLATVPACGSAPLSGPADVGAASAVAVLAPTGVLRVGVYPGSPTSLVRRPGGAEPAGLAHDLGLALGRQLGVPVRLQEYSRAAQVLEALKSGQIDVTFTNASPQRAQEVAFALPLVQLELGYLVPAASRLQAMAQIDQPGVRVGVLQGSTSQSSLARLYAHAGVVPVASVADIQAQLRSGALDAYATNKGILHELADAMPGSRVLDGRWGAEQLALAVPKGREAGLPVLEQFAQTQRASGALQQAIQRAGLRGALPLP